MEEKKIQPNFDRVQLTQYQPVAASERIDRGGYITYGDENNYPQYLKTLASTSPVHGALVKGIAKMVAGKRLTSPIVSDDGIISKYRLNRLVPSIANDIVLYGGFYTEYIKTLDRTGVAAVNHLPFENCRLAANETGEITGIFYSRNWQETRKKINKPEFVPLIDKQIEGYEDSARYVKISFLDECTSTYYPEPSYKSCINYVEVDRAASQYHVSNLLNGFFPQLHMHFSNGQPDPEVKAAMKRDINAETGAGRAGQIFFTFGEADQPSPQITTFPLSDADKQYDQLDRNATQKILTGHLVTTPLLFGIKLSGDGFSSNAEEQKEGYRLFMMNVVQPMQMQIIDSFVETLQLVQPEIEQNEYFTSDEPQATKDAPTTDAAPVENVASQALNGAQIESLVNIIMQAAAQTLPISSAKAVVAAGFPMLTPAMIDNIFGAIVPGSIPQAQVLRSIVLSAIEKKKDMTIADEDAWLEYLYEKGEQIDLDEYVLVDEEVISDHPKPDEELSQVKLFKRFAKPNEKSENDGGLIKVRYKYSQNISDNSRRFCKAMVEASKAGVVYRYEDIVRMGDSGVNSEFAAAGESTYSIFLYKGGVNCHHNWSRQIYMRKRDGGKFLPNKGLKNDKEISNMDARRLGFSFKDSVYWMKAKMKPINMPNQGRKN